MAIHTNVQQETRRRDGVSNDGIAGDSLASDGEFASAHAIKATTGSIRHLAGLLEKSAQTMRHASENVENRGLKLLLKVKAQERVAMYNSLRRAAGKELEDPLDPAHKSPATSLQEGLQDIQSSMTVQRQGRETVALSHLVEEEEDLLEAYNSVLERDGPAPLREMLQSQRANVARFYERLQLVGSGIEPIVARVFNSRIEGESAIARLRGRGLDESQIDSVAITQVAQPVLRTAAATSSPMSAVGAGAFSGALIGGVIGLALALFVWMAPQLVGWVVVGPWALLLGAIAIGAIFGSVFGFFIGQNQREIDLAETADGLVNGEILVVAYPQPHLLPMVEEVLQLHHAREVNR